MSQFIKATLDIQEALRAIDAIGRNAPRAIARAINRAASSGRALMTREIAKDTGIRSGDVRDQIKILRAEPNKLSASLYVTGKRIPIIAFSARGPEPSRGRGRGVSWKLPTGRGRNENAFIATMSNGHRGVFKRVGKQRLGITELHGPSLPHVFAKFLDVGKARAQEQLKKNLQSEIRFAQLK